MVYKLIDDKHKVLTRENDHTEMLMDVDVITLKKDEVYSVFSENKEIAILLTQGHIAFNKPVKVEFKRTNVFDDTPKVVHSSKATKFEIVALEESEILVQKTTNENTFETVVYSDVEESKLQSPEFNERDLRLIRTVFDYDNAPYSNMVLGEVITLEGNWSSYLPHSHRQPEVYYYKMSHKNGFGCCFIDDQTYKIFDESFAAIPGGTTHPQVVAPGYKMYYCWMIRHLENDPWNERIFDEKHLHLLGEEK